MKSNSIPFVPGGLYQSFFNFSTRTLLFQIKAVCQLCPFLDFFKICFILSPKGSPPPRRFLSFGIHCAVAIVFGVFFVFNLNYFVLVYSVTYAEIQFPQLEYNLHLIRIPPPEGRAVSDIIIPKHHSGCFWLQSNKKPPAQTGSKGKDICCLF